MAHLPFLFARSRKARWFNYPLTGRDIHGQQSLFRSRRTTYLIKSRPRVLLGLHPANQYPASRWHGVRLRALNDAGDVRLRDRLRYLDHRLIGPRSAPGVAAGISIRRVTSGRKHAGSSHRTLSLLPQTSSPIQVVVPYNGNRNSNGGYLPPALSQAGDVLKVRY